MKSPFYYNHITSSSCYTYFMLSITPTLSLDESEIQFDYVRAAGPGGQNVNMPWRTADTFLAAI